MVIILAGVALVMVAAFQPGIAATLLDGAELIGQYAPNFELFDYKRELHRLYDLKGRVVLVVFWQTGDSNCENALKALEAIYQKHKESGLEIFAIDIYARSTDALMFLSKNDLSYVFVEGILGDAVKPAK